MSAEFRIGRVVGRSLSIFFRDAVFLTAMTVLVYVVWILIALVPVLVLWVTSDDAAAVLRHLAPRNGPRAPPIDPDAMDYYVVLNVVAAPAYLLAYALFIALVIERTMHKVLGISPGLRETLRRGLRAALTLAGAAIIVVAMFWAGMSLLVLPGLLVAVVLWVALPAVVVERVRVFASMSRSAELTKGHRWRVLGIVLLYILLSFVVPYVVLLVFAVIGSLMGPVGLGVMTGIGLVVMTVFAAVLAPLMATVTYHDLRLVKEGGALEDIAEVFE